MRKVELTMEKDSLETVLARLKERPATKKLREERIKILSKYNGITIHYELEQKLIKELYLSNRKDLLDCFKMQGYYIQWDDRYNAKGKRFYTPIKKVVK